MQLVIIVIAQLVIILLEISSLFCWHNAGGIGVAHNGNLTNAEDLTKELYKENLRHINTNSDSEILLNILANELENNRKSTDAPNLKPDDLFKAVNGLHKRCSGGYAVVGMIAGYGLFAFRDPNGIRPLVFGKNNNGVIYLATTINFCQSFDKYLIHPDIKHLMLHYLGEDYRISSTSTQINEQNNKKGDWHADWPFCVFNGGNINKPFPKKVLSYYLHI